MRRPPDSKDPKAGEEQPTPGGHARDRMDLFNRQRGLPTDGETSDKKSDPDAEKTPPKGKRSDA